MTEVDPSAGLSDTSLLTLRLFPLPQTVLFPGTVLPLHIFEPRYREMVQDALDGDRVVAIAQLMPGYDEAGNQSRPAIHPVVGVGRIIQAQRVKDGRYYMALHGIARARVLVEHLQVKPWREARAERIVDEMEDGDDSVKDAVITLKTVLARLVERIPDRAESLAGIIEEITSPGALADVLCAAALESAQDRQSALETSDVRERLELATDAVAGLLLKAGENDEPAAQPM